MTQMILEKQVTVGAIKEECDIFHSVTDVVVALNDLNRPDLLGEFDAIFVNFSAEDTIEAAYGCRGCWDSDETILEEIKMGAPFIENEFGQPVTLGL